MNRIDQYFRDPTIDTPVTDYYIVRVDNDCPAAGNTGADSLGVPRPATGCP